MNIQEQIKPEIQKEIPSKKQPNTTKIRKDIFNRLEIIEDSADIGVGFQSGSQKRSGLKLALWTWLSAAIDGLVLISISCFFAIAFSYLMKVSPSSLIVSTIKNQHAATNIALLFTLSLWSYLIFMRAFIGASIGEWTCDLRLGQPVQRLQKSYVLKVILRTTLILLSGIVIIPLVSLLISRDIAGEISGIRIYSLQ